MNNTYILIYSHLIERNYIILKQIYEKCAKWAKRYRAKFILEKYELIYFITQLKRFNIKIIININKI